MALADFFGSGRGAGRQRDFLTSPELGPLFGTVLARALDEWWAELGEPDPFVVVEAGAGRGALARAVVDARPACAPALRYVLVESSETLREQQVGVVPLEPPHWVLGPTEREEDEDVEPVAGVGPLLTSLAELPAQPFTGVLLANELLDNLPPVLLERTADGWAEVRVTLEGDRLAELLVPVAPELGEEADRLVPHAPVGARVPLQHAARDWLRRALAVVERGRVVVVDYADGTPAMAARPWRDWLRTYRSHGRGGHPLDEPGTQDVTCEVAVDQLRPPPAADRSQADFLRAHGIDELVAEARAVWQERAHVGDLEAVKARSLVSEAEALTDPAGLGAFRVLEWRIP